jgi:hypothetical protein
MAVIMKRTAFWCMTPCSKVRIYRRFGEKSRKNAYYFFGLPFDREDWDSRFLLNVNKILHPGVVCQKMVVFR